MGYFLDPSAVQLVQNIAQQASQPSKGLIARIIGVALRAFCEWCVRPASGRVEHDLGRNGKSRSRSLGILARTLSIICTGHRNLSPAARFANS